MERPLECDNSDFVPSIYRHSRWEQEHTLEWPSRKHELLDRLQWECFYCHLHEWVEHVINSVSLSLYWNCWFAQTVFSHSCVSIPYQMRMFSCSHSSILIPLRISGWVRTSRSLGIYQLSQLGIYITKCGCVPHVTHIHWWVWSSQHFSRTMRVTLTVQPPFLKILATPLP